MDLDIATAPCWPDAKDWALVAEDAARASAQVAPELANPRLSASVVFTDDDTQRDLNREWRGKDAPTNVLSFPMLDRSEFLAAASEGPPMLVGDVVLAWQTCEREAAGKAIPLTDHATHLLIHGLLHLAGYDHETGSEDAAAMERLETKALAILGIPDPYGCLD